MGLFELRKPKWRHKDPAVRLESIASIDPGKTEVLSDLGRNDPDRAALAVMFPTFHHFAPLLGILPSESTASMPIPHPWRKGQVG